VLFRSVLSSSEATLAACEKRGVRSRPTDDAGRRGDQDIVVDCTGNADGLVTAMKMVRPRGTIVLKTTVAPGQSPGQFPDQSPGQTRSSGHPGIDLSPLVIHEINLIGSRCGPFTEALAALAADRIDVVSLISRRMTLADGVEAMRHAASGAIKVLMEP